MGISGREPVVPCSIPYMAPDLPSLAPGPQVLVPPAPSYLPGVEVIRQWGSSLSSASGQLAPAALWGVSESARGGFRPLALRAQQHTCASSQLPTKTMSKAGARVKFRAQNCTESEPGERTDGPMDSIFCWKKTYQLRARGQGAGGLIPAQPWTPCGSASLKRGGF